jgi:hypothetical protein
VFEDDGKQLLSKKKMAPNRPNRLLSAFEVRHMSQTIVEYVANIDGSPYFSWIWWLQVFLKHRILFVLISVAWATVTFVLHQSMLHMFAASVGFGTILFLIFHNLAIEESVTIIHQFGIQLKRKYFFGREKVQFIEIERLHAVFIHEYIKGCQVHFGLAFELKHRSSPVVQSSQFPMHLSSVGGKGNMSPPSHHISSGQLSPSGNSLQSFSSFLPQQHSANQGSSGNTSSGNNSNNNVGSPRTSLIVLFQEVYPGYEALRKVYRACAMETEES